MNFDFHVTFNLTTQVVITLAPTISGIAWFLIKGKKKNARNKQA